MGRGKESYVRRSGGRERREERRTSKERGVGAFAALPIGEGVWPVTKGAADDEGKRVW